MKINIKLKKYIPYLLLLLPFFFISITIDNDFWFTINQGRYILNNGFTYIEPFTVHQDFSFSFEKWMTSIIFYVIYNRAGEQGIFKMLFIAGAIIELLIYLNVSYISNNKNLNIIITSLNSIILFKFFLVTRPHIFSLILLLLEFWLMEHYVRTQKYIYLVPLPCISMLYMQLHSTMWPVFFIVLMPYIFDIPLIAKKLKFRKARYKKTLIVIATIISFLIGFINPNESISVFYLFNSTDVNIGLISELENLTVIKLFTYCGIILLPHLYYWIKRFIDYKNNSRYPNDFAYKKMLNVLPLRYFYFLIGTLIMAVFALRNMSYYIVFGGIITAYMLERVEIENKNMVRLVVICALAILLSISALLTPYNSTPEKAAIDEFRLIYNKEENQNIRLFTEFNTGAYAEWMGFKAYIDPRAEVFTKKINGKEDILKEYSNLRTGHISYKDIQEKYNFTHWLLKKGDLINTYLSDDENYKKIIEKDNFLIYEYLGN